MSCARLRHREAEQLLDREAEGVLLVHRRDIVEPVEIRDRLQIGLVLDQLLGAAMQQADMRIDALDHLAVELEHQAQHAVRRRMLRPEIDGEVAQRGFGHRARAYACACAIRTWTRHRTRVEHSHRHARLTKRSCRASRRSSVARPSMRRSRRTLTQAIVGRRSACIRHRP